MIGWVAAFGAGLIIVVYEIVLGRWSRGQRLGWMARTPSEPVAVGRLVTITSILLLVVALQLIGRIAFLVVGVAWAMTLCLRFVHNRRLARGRQGGTRTVSRG